MEEWEEKHIDINLSRLLKLTKTSPRFLAELKRLFSDNEIDTVKCERTEDDKAWKLYDIAKTKPGGYDELTRAFDNHKMLGPLQIFLEGYEKNGKTCPLDMKTSKGGGSSSGSGKSRPQASIDMGKIDTLVVGEEGCEKQDVIETIRECKSFHRFRAEWRSVANYLKIDDDLIEALADDFLLGVRIKGLPQLLERLLSDWTGEKGDQAKLSLLCDALKKNHLLDIAQCLEKRFG